MDQFNGFIGFAGVGGAIIVSMGLAMWMEWYCLRLLMRLMPGRMKALQAASTMNVTEADEASLDADRAATEMDAARAPARPARGEIRLGV
jgi:hypothetical protein